MKKIILVLGILSLLVIPLPLLMGCGDAVVSAATAAAPASTPTPTISSNVSIAQLYEIHKNKGLESLIGKTIIITGVLEEEIYFNMAADPFFLIASGNSYIRILCYYTFEAGKELKAFNPPLGKGSSLTVKAIIKSENTGTISLNMLCTMGAFAGIQITEVMK